ncbi:MAG: alcohol dehydrogenase catalytic domain-containing protein [Verrucomicrobiota bacterium]|jgi:L-iditol 2-dehydrogenase
MIIPETMRAVVYHGANDLRLQTVPVPEIQPGELLVRVAVCGVCPTDIKKIHLGALSPPRIFGHETAGVIVRIGAGVRKFRLGDRVALHHHVPCLNCDFCRRRAFAQCPGYKRTGVTAGFEPAGGGFAEFVRVMPFVLPGVVKIPAPNSFEEGAMLEPVNTVLKAVLRLALRPGDHVLVVGQGPIGLMFTRLFRLRGVKVIATDLMDSRIKLARQWGAVAAFKATHSNLLAKIRNTAPCLDAAVVAVPSQEALTQAFALVRGSGKILLFAHTRRGDASLLDLSNVCVDEKDLLGSYSSDFTLQAEVARLVFTRQLDTRRLITHRFPLKMAASAVALAGSPVSKSLKVVVNQPLAT